MNPMKVFKIPSPEMLFRCVDMMKYRDDKYRTWQLACQWKDQRHRWRFILQLDNHAEVFYRDEHGKLHRVGAMYIEAARDFVKGFEEA